MTTRIRDQFQLDDMADDAATASGDLRMLLGVPRHSDAATAEVRLRIDQVIGGTMIAVFSGFLTLFTLSFLLEPDLRAAVPAALAIIASGAVGIAADLLLLARRDNLRANADQPQRTVTTLAGFGVLSSAGWAASAIMIGQQDLGFAYVLAGTPLLLGMVAASALPALCLGRILLAALVILLLDGPSAGLAALALASVLVAVANTMMTARRQQAVRGMIAEHELIRRSRDLIIAMENSGRGWFWQTNARGRLTYISPPAAARFGKEEGALIGTHFAKLLTASTSASFDESQTPPDDRIHPGRRRAVQRHHRARAGRSRALVVAVGGAGRRRPRSLPWL